MRHLIALLLVLGGGVHQVEALCTKPPQLSLSVPSTGTVGTSVTVIGKVNKPSGNRGCSIATWTLTYGDGESQSGTAVVSFKYSHIYASANTFTVRLTAFNQDGVSRTVSATIRVTTATEVPSRPGPTPDITCPAGSVSIPVNSNIQTFIDSSVGATTFCLAAGTYNITRSLAPKTGNTFIGQYGAILDGTGWTTTDLDAAFFKAINNGITGVTIKNLVMRNGPSYCVNSYLTAASWVVDHNEIYRCRSGISVGTGGTISSNFIHHNVGVTGDPRPELRGGGYTLNSSRGVSLVDNEISYNGTEQKFIYGTLNVFNQDLTIARNFVHHNVGNGLWIDGDGAGSVIENNTVEDNGAAGIDIEQGNGVIVRNNTVRRQLGGEGIYITISKDTSITGNTVEGNAFGIGLFLDFSSLPPASPSLPWSQDLSGNVITGNIVRASTGQYLGMLTFTGSGDKTPYTSNSKNNQWSNNTYFAPNTTGTWFSWDGNKTFTQWQALPQDATSTIAIQ